MVNKKILFFLSAFGASLILVISYISQNHKNLSSQHPIKKSPTPLISTITLIATGDVMLGRTINYHSVKNNNFTWMWEKVAKELQEADLSLINLESPLVKNCPVSNEGMIFCANEKNIEGLKIAGIDLVNLANNHIGNFEQEGIETTVHLLNQLGISPVGTEKPVFKNAKNIRFALLGYSDFGAPQGISQAKKEKIAQEINEAKNQADIVVVSFHWGVEYTDQPTSRQKELAYLAIDSGADLVLGHHPHWIQPEEFYKEKLIVYSLGNFIFDQFWSEKTTKGVLGEFVFQDKKLVSYRLIPIKIIPPGQPVLEKFP